MIPDKEFIQALERHSQDRECEIPRQYLKEAMERIKNGQEAVVAEVFGGRPVLQDAYYVALRLYLATLS